MKIFAATLAGAFVPYLVCAFIAWNADVSAWTWDGRFALAMLSGVGATFAWLFASELS